MDRLLDNLNEPQRDAVTHVEGPMLILAGAGSGKTRAITYRLAHLIASGVAPWHVLAITFTNKAAREMASRVETLQIPSGALLCTFHALCARLLREFAERAGLQPNYTIYDRDDQVRLTKEAIAIAGVPVANFPPSRVHASIGRAKNRLRTPTACADEAQSFHEEQVAKVYAQYQKLLAANNALDFDDLLLRTAFMLRDNADVGEILSQRYRYVMIDEYQDTNHAQYLLAQAIAGPHGNLCVTGDPDQSIYAWRGADISNILEFEKDYPDARIVVLDENYRSTKAILHGASNLISHNTHRKEKALWTRKTGGADVKVVYCNDEHAEAQLIAERIAELRAEGLPAEQMAVFYRVNSLSRVVENALRENAIPYRIARGVEFYNRKEVKDVLAYLKVIINPVDDLSCLRVINLPARGIGATTVKRLVEHARMSGKSVLEVCKDGLAAGLRAAAAKKVAAFHDLIISFAALKDRPVAQIANHIIDTISLKDAFGGDDAPDSSAWRNVGELVNNAAEFDSRSEGGTLEEYLHQVALIADVDHMEGGDGAVTLMTLHSAKGLEFPAVFIVGWELGLLPFHRGDQMRPRHLGSSPEDEEERRLAFVGMTRAMEHLTLTCARKRMQRGRTETQIASPFLNEIGTEMVDVEDRTTPPTNPWANRPGPRGGFHDDTCVREMIEAADIDEAFPPEYEYLRAGSMVQHPTFGRGRVVARGTQRWPETRLEIHFEDLGPKTIKLSVVRLELLEE
ncbi:MAG: UvrD-helicase domain-containing protein [Phycisphaerae bacterium]|nr:UvrD-helicase domain-containing protein [Phycisphaerae bacterium]